MSVVLQDYYSLWVFLVDDFIDFGQPFCDLVLDMIK